MKRWIAILLLVLALAGLLGCVQDKEFVYPVSYHYLRAPLANGEIQHGTADSLIAAELREGNGYQNNLALLLDLYLHGPLDQDHRTPFPVGTALRELSVKDSVATVVLSRQFASLTGIDLSLACGCLTLTVMDLTGAETVVISAEDTLLDGAESISMNRESMILIDNTTIETD